MTADGSGHEDHKGHKDHEEEKMFLFVIFVSFVGFVPPPWRVSSNRRRYVVPRFASS